MSSWKLLTPGYGAPKMAGYWPGTSSHLDRALRDSNAYQGNNGVMQ